MTFTSEFAQNGNEIIAALNVSGDSLAPETVTEVTGLQPTKKWVAGEAIGRSTRRYQQNGWSIATKRECTVDDAVNALLAILTPGWSRIVEATRDQYVELSIVVHANSFIPEIHINADQLRLLAEVNAHIDIDLYDFTTDRDRENDAGTNSGA